MSYAKIYIIYIFFCFDIDNFVTLCIMCPNVTNSSSFAIKFQFLIKKGQWRKIHKIIRATTLWVGRRSEPISGYISKFDGKNNSGRKGFKTKTSLLTAWVKKSWAFFFLENLSRVRLQCLRRKKTSASYLFWKQTNSALVDSNCRIFTYTVAEETKTRS